MGSKVFGLPHPYIPLEEMVEAQEAFLTNSVKEIVPITELDGKAIGDGEPGAITRRLMGTYRGLVLRETRPSKFLE